MRTCLQLAYLFSFIFLPVMNAQSFEIRVVTEKLQSIPLTTELTLSGTLRPLHETELSVAAEALVTALHVDVGSRVKRGDLLLELDADLARQQHLQAVAQVSAAKFTAIETQRLWDEGLRLKDKNHISQSEISSRESSASLAKAQLEQAQANARIAEKQLDYHQLYAPFDGVISARWTDLGQWLTRGDQVFTLVSLNNLRLDVRLPQEQLTNIENLQSVQIQPDTQPQLKIPAHIDTLVPVGDTARSFLLRITADKISTALLPGTSAKALLNFKHAQIAVVLPRDAVLRNVDGNYTAFVIENGIAQRRKITLGAAGRNGYIVKDGLAPGEQVVIRGNEVLNDGNAVVIVDKLSQTP